MKYTYAMIALSVLLASCSNDGNDVTDGTDNQSPGKLTGVVTVELGDHRYEAAINCLKRDGYTGFVTIGDNQMWVGDPKADANGDGLVIVGNFNTGGRSDVEIDDIKGGLHWFSGSGIGKLDNWQAEGDTITGSGVFLEDRNMPRSSKGTFTAKCS